MVCFKLHILSFTTSKEPSSGIPYLETEQAPWSSILRSSTNRNQIVGRECRPSTKSNGQKIQHVSNLIQGFIDRVKLHAATTRFTSHPLTHHLAYIDCASSTKSSTRRHDRRTSCKLFGFVGMPEERKFAIRKQVTWVECRMDDLRVVVVVWTLLDNQDGKFGICFCETSSNHTTSQATCKTVQLLEMTDIKQNWDD